MAKHKPTVVWAVKRTGGYPNGYVRTEDEKHLDISFFLEEGRDGAGFTVTRQFAKMLARRINQCLEATK